MNSRQSRQTGGYGRSRNAAPAVRTIPTPRKQPHPYRGSEGNHDPYWVTEAAEQVANDCRELPPTQLRRFFSEVKGLARQLDLLTSQDKGDARRLEKGDAWARIHPQFAMLKSKVVYAAGRLGKKMPNAFVQFIVDHVAWVQSAEDFEVFLSHFEAVVGFHRYLTTAKG